MAPKAGSRRRTTTVKSGCSTCKSRKVKCDEAFPACRRCVSTGRVCQGYGVWGGGGTKYQSQKPGPAEYKGDFSIAPEITSLVVDRIDSALFEWYRCRTATKIPGAYFSDFWTVLLPQASHTEPAVLHAVLALSATHWDGSKEWNLCKQGLRDDGPENMERLTLQHYNQAIQHLKTPLSTQAESSRRVALITCLIFIAVDLLRGHFATAQFHLRSGLKLLGEERISTATDKLARENQSPDRWISEVFTRLLVQAELFGNPYDHPKLVLDAVELFPQTARFASFKEAWAGLQSLTNATFALTQQAREVNAIQPDCAATNPELLGHQQRLRAGLSWWSTTYEASEQALTVHGPTESSVAFHVLRTHHLMGLIMVNAALSPDDEMIYDQHTECFMRLLKELADIWTKSSLRAAEGGVPVQRLADSRSSIVDMGWIQPLYYAVTKCRIHRLRMQAIRCLEYSYHREGFWDSEIVARVSRQVMKIEEGDFYKNYEINDDFPITATATTEEMDLPVLPAARRIKGLEVVLSGSPMSEILLYSRQGTSRVGDRVCVGKFDVRSQQWVDG